MNIPAISSLISTHPTEFKPQTARQNTTSEPAISAEEAAQAAKSVAAYFATHEQDSLAGSSTLELMVA